ncbi:hypothetical protein RBH29_01300 [Herbivorax sp. ANBcel31]|uniref:hypothetical protein n=1 Tax=Herbivorax sp. ANBcel31 TaxID=3069754 RepID=UPI0027B1D33C|nr:hypothetical protein [Herbivorax sp. ANBcel31]MDQ2085074.1 hypothetical protein [Herbivorax sp. ANBcel31]
MFVKNNLVIFLTFFLISVFGVGYMIVFPMINNWNFEIETVFGGKELLDDVYISGEIMDRYSLTEFSIGKEKNTVKFNLFKNRNHFNFYYNRLESTVVAVVLGRGDYVNYIERSSFRYNRKFDFGIYECWLSSSMYGDEIYVYRRKKGEDYGDKITVETNTECWRVKSIIDSREYILNIGERLFFIAPIRSFDSSDEIYIYELLNYDGDMEYKKLADVSMYSENSGIIEFLSIDNRLIIRKGYKLINIDIDTGEVTDKYEFREVSSLDKVFIDGNTLIMLSTGSGLKEAYAFEITDKIEKVGYIEDIYEEMKALVYQGIFKNEKFYMLQKKFLFPLEEGADGKIVLAVSVYDKNGEHLYYGYVKNDMSDDWIYDKNIDIIPHNLSNRKYYDFKIEY